MDAKAATEHRNLQASLRRCNGPLRETSYRLRGDVFRAGRDLENDLVIEGPEAAIVSSRHLEIRRAANTFRLVDLDSTNGTYLDGQRVSEALLQNHVLITLGPSGPKFQFELEVASEADFSQTLRLPVTPSLLPGQPAGQVSILVPAPPTGKQNQILKEAIKRARQARRSGIGGQTSIIMREMLDKALHRSSQKFKITIGVLVFALMGVSGYAGWTIHNLKRQKTQIDGEINQVEMELQSAEDNPKRVDELLEKLNGYQQQALTMQKILLYRLGVRSEEQDFVEAEIKALLKGFGAEEYSISKEFTEQVRRFIGQYQERDRPHMERALGRSRTELEEVRRQLESDNLPPDLAYMVLVESAFIGGSTSSAGAAGLWQFTPTTAKAYGLKVGNGIDERLDARKSTAAAGRYIRELILDFGSGSSVMLALAAYNSGPSQVKRAIRTVSDPIKQRDFWYLYRTKALPPETREYIPKTIGVIIIGRHPARFGFS
ncbi:MAG: FHA domain-containing protein [Acidobacteria bacterium]|nr:FHA domain-containing protein [Acidobacteriota bacterium]